VQAGAGPGVAAEAGEPAEGKRREKKRRRGKRKKREKEIGK
jgi:hypothetical protein